MTNGGLEDSAELQRYGAGRPAINFAGATRYLHSHNSMIERRDLDQAVSLLVKVPSILDAHKVKEISQFQSRTITCAVNTSPPHGRSPHYNRTELRSRDSLEVAAFPDHSTLATECRIPGFVGCVFR